MLRGYHSFSAAGTEYTPQWMKMPNFASLYHCGCWYFISVAQSARYGPSFSCFCFFGQQAVALGVVLGSPTAATRGRSPQPTYAQRGRQRIGVCGGSLRKNQRRGQEQSDRKNSN